MAKGPRRMWQTRFLLRGPRNPVGPLQPLMVMVNLPTAGVDYHVPFGGRKGSRLGQREQGPMAMAFYTSVKTSQIFAG